MRPEGLLAATERVGGSVTRRDRVVLWALGVGALLTLLTWRFVGPWPALVLFLLAMGVACVAYRIEPPRIDVDHPERWGGPSADAGGADASTADTRLDAR